MALIMHLRYMYTHTGVKGNLIWVQTYILLAVLLLCDDLELV